jgi:splicing factor U2AF subunit
MWPNPMATNAVPSSDDKGLQAQFDEYYEDVFEELSNFGEVEELNVCENLGDHLIGNVYAKFHKEEEASEALNKLQGRFYGGMWDIIYVLSFLSDFFTLGANYRPFRSVG